MSIYAPGTFSGNYQASTWEELQHAQIAFISEYGAPRVPTQSNNLVDSAGKHTPGAEANFGVVNSELAQYYIDHYARLPLYAGVNTGGALHQIAPEVKLAGEFLPISANYFASKRGSGTWAELQELKSSLGNTEQPIVIIAQAYHAGRVAMQAKKAGFTPLLPPNLPRDFDHGSKQVWCHGPKLWAVRELIGVALLRMWHQL